MLKNKTTQTLLNQLKNINKYKIKEIFVKKIKNLHWSLIFKLSKKQII